MDPLDDSHGFEGSEVAKAEIQDIKGWEESGNDP